MRKLFVLFLTLSMLFVAASLASCSEEEKPEEVKLTSYEEFLKAEVDTEVVVDTFIQARQGWWSDDKGGKASLYTQNDEGGYFIYNLACTKEDYDSKLVVGAHIRLAGKKGEWAGEIEVVDATYSVLSGTKVYPAVDVTDKLGTDDLKAYMNKKVAFNELEIVASNEAGAAFLYKWDGSGKQGDDIYFKASDGKATYTFTVESYLCGKETPTYQAVEALKVGDHVNLEGFLYWYEGPQPHISAVSTLK